MWALLATERSPSENRREVSISSDFGLSCLDFIIARLPLRTVDIFLGFKSGRRPAKVQALAEG